MWKMNVQGKSLKNVTLGILLIMNTKELKFFFFLDVNF